MKKAIIAVSLLFVIVLLQCCSKTDAVPEVTSPVAVITSTLQLNLPASVFFYVVAYPAHIQIALNADDNMPADNAPTNDGAILGRVLF
jgi:hypothetical protein